MICFYNANAMMKQDAIREIINDGNVLTTPMKQKNEYSGCFFYLLVRNNGSCPCLAEFSSMPPLGAADDVEDGASLVGGIVDPYCSLTLARNIVDESVPF